MVLTLLRVFLLGLAISASLVVGDSDTCGNAALPAEDRSLIQKEVAAHNKKIASDSQAPSTNSVHKSASLGRTENLLGKTRQQQEVLALAHSHSSASELLEKQAPNAADVSHKSWLDRMGDALAGVASGLFIVIPFSIALLWMNERRNAQLESLISVGFSEAETVETADEKAASFNSYDGALVHMNDAIARGLEPIVDARFPIVKMDSGCIKLSSDVEVYQWKETKHEEKKKDSVGGGETTVTTYSYQKVWSGRLIPSGGFREGGHHNTSHVSGLDPGDETAINKTVKYGQHWNLPAPLIAQINNFEDANKLAGDELKFGSYTFTLSGGYFLCPSNSSPQIGDFRVRFQYALDTPASILALQMPDKSGSGFSFGPYRSVPRGLCGHLGDDELHHRLLKQAKMDGDELYEEDKCLDFGPFACLCGCCNLVSYCFTHCSTAMLGMVSLTPEIYSLWTAKVAKRECFNSVASSGTSLKWALRILGWILLWAGFEMLFKPLEVAFDIIPFLGPYLGSFIKFGISFLSFFCTMVIAIFLVSAAYLIYHPLLGMLYTLISVGIISAVMYVSHMSSVKP